MGWVQWLIISRLITFVLDPHDKAKLPKLRDIFSLSTWLNLLDLVLDIEPKIEPSNVISEEGKLI